MQIKLQPLIVRLELSEANNHRVATEYEIWYQNIEAAIKTHKQEYQGSCTAQMRQSTSFQKHEIEHRQTNSQAHIINERACSAEQGELYLSSTKC